MESGMAATSPAGGSKRRAPRRKRVGPTVGELVIKAVSASNERSGVSAAAVNKALAAEGYNVKKNKASVKTAIKRLLNKGTLVRTKGTGVSGSFKINDEPKAKKPVKRARKAKRTSRKAKRTPRRARKTTRKGKKRAKKPRAAKKPKSRAGKKSASTKRSRKRGKRSAAARKATKRVKKSQPRKLRRRMSTPKKN